MSASAESPRELLLRPVEEVAPRLLGWLLSDGEVTVRLTEVEAYAADTDPGSHAHRGPTARNATMFGPPGRLYAYLVYGMHVCANVVTGPQGQAAAVLVRAGEVVEGLATARSRRPQTPDAVLARGPALLCRTLAVDLRADGTDLMAGGPWSLRPGPAPTAVSRGPRVGLRGAPERCWRWWETAHPSVSAYRPATPRRGR